MLPCPCRHIKVFQFEMWVSVFQFLTSLSPLEKLRWLEKKLDNGTRNRIYIGQNIVIILGPCQVRLVGLALK